MRASAPVAYPPAKFYFSVGVLGAGASPSGQPTIDSSFQEVSGINVEFEVEEFAEGGENRFAHRLPKRAKYPPLVCKRGLVVSGSALGAWVAATLDATLSTPIAPKDLQVSLLGPNGDPLVSWAFYGAWPLRWNTAALNSTENEVLTETLEFAYRFFVRSGA